MTTYVHHDAEGNIKGVVVVKSGDKVGLMLAPGPGVFVSKVEELKFKSETPSHKEIVDLIKNFKIDTSASAKLTKQTRKK